MKNTLIFYLIVIFVFNGKLVYAQTTTLTTGLPNSATSLVNAVQAGITFTITNSNPYPIVLKSMDVYTAATQSNATFTLRYSATSLSGAPSNAIAWTSIATATAGTISATAIVPMFTNINFTIPANTTYRLLMHNSVADLNYGSATTTPNSFTAAGVTIGRGNYMINSQTVGYSGSSPNYNSFGPRFWSGTIVFEPAIANNVSAKMLLNPLANSSYCYNSSVTVTTVIENKGSAAQTNFPVNAFYTGNGGNGVLTSVYTDTLLPGQLDTVTVGSFTALPSTYSVYAYTALVNDSLTSDDTSAPRLVTILQPVPSPQTVSDTVCAGGNVLLDIANVTPGMQFKWYSALSGGTVLYTGTSLTFTSINQDTTMYVAAVINNCESARVPIHGAIGPPPVVDLGDDTSFCESIPLILDAGNPGGKYMWSNGDSTQSIAITDQSGMYWVVVDKYCKSSDTVNVTIRSLPYASGISYVRMSNTYHFTASSVQDVESYLWLFGDGNSSTDTTPVHTYSTSVNVPSQVMLIVMNTCGADTIYRTVPTGIQDPPDKYDLSVYPNPADGKLFIESGSLTLQQAYLVNMMGAIIKREVLTGNITQLDVRDLPPGNYILRINTDKGNINKTIQITRR